MYVVYIVCSLNVVVFLHIDMYTIYLYITYSLSAYMQPVTFIWLLLVTIDLGEFPKSRRDAVHANAYKGIGIECSPPENGYPGNVAVGLPHSCSLDLTWCNLIAIGSSAENAPKPPTQMPLVIFPREMLPSGCLLISLDSYKSKYCQLELQDDSFF